MPGISLEKVRFMGKEDENIWDFPRLYVDDESYVWKYALINKGKIYDAFLSITKYYRKRMELEMACRLIKQFIIVYSKYEKNNLDEDDFLCLGLMSVAADKVLLKLGKGYRKEDIKMLDILIEQLEILVVQMNED